MAKTTGSWLAPVMLAGGASLLVFSALGPVQAEMVPEVSTLVDLLSRGSGSTAELQAEDFVLGFSNEFSEQAGATSPVNALSIVDRFRELPAAAVDVRFKGGSAVVNPGSVPVIEAVGRALTNTALSKTQFIIIDHTNTSDGRDADLALSQRRAEAIRLLLVDQFGIPDARIKAEGYGEEWLDKIVVPKGQPASRIEIVAIIPAGEN